MEQSGELLCGLVVVLAIVHSRKISTFPKLRSLNLILKGGNLVYSIGITNGMPLIVEVLISGRVLG